VPTGNRRISLSICHSNVEVFNSIVLTGKRKCEELINRLATKLISKFLKINLNIYLQLKYNHRQSSELYFPISILEFFELII